MSATAYTGFQTEIEFELPKGYVDRGGNASWTRDLAIGGVLKQRQREESGAD